mmetsp:Transcript_25323/g.48499  ORF Transcript_25323/g.48499 Transcript_25323/m.48499 type:complete len:355 (+) Transcript_25323:56-1120(+)
MGMLKSLGGFVVAVAVAIGTIGKLKPELFLQIPHFGFIPWAMTGGIMPPYFQPSVWSEENSKSFLTKGDVVVASGGKAGSVWLMTLMHLLRSKGDDSYNSISDVAGMVEIVTYPGQTPAQAIEAQLQKKENNPSMRPWFWWGHSSPKDPKVVGLNPKANPNIKYVLVARNGKEVVRSIYPFINAHGQEFKTMWGGFPPKLSGPEEAFKMFAVDMPQFFFEYTRDWWAFRNEKNVMLLHFADLKKDLSASAHKLAKFLELEVPEDAMDLVLQKAPYKYMKEHHQQKVRSCVSQWPGTNHTICPVDEGGHINKGETGGADSFFTPAMHEQWDKLVDKYFGSQPELKEWAENGGAFK